MSGGLVSCERNDLVKMEDQCTNGIWTRAARTNDLRKYDPEDRLVIWPQWKIRNVLISFLVYSLFSIKQDISVEKKNSVDVCGMSKGLLLKCYVFVWIPIEI